MPPLLSVLRPTGALLLFALLLGTGCKRLEKDLPPAVTAAIQSVQEKHCPDRRLCVFNVQVVMLGANLKLTGELSDPRVRNELVAAVKEAAPNFKVEEEIRLLPDETLGGRRFAIVRTAVANMRSAPEHPAELSNQLLMGSLLSLLKKERGWYYAQAEDGYLGWLPSSSLKVVTQEGLDAWLAGDLVAFNRLDGVVHHEPRAGALPVSALVWGCTLRRLETLESKTGAGKQKWVRVELPDGRQGFVEAELLSERDKVFPTTPGTTAGVVATAQKFLGVPYLWGGTSPNGFDCSGFTQMVFRLNGVALLRDASQQARQGDAVDAGRNFENLQPADLLFFGEQEDRISHVAISLGGPRFIHASDFVEINSLAEEDEDYSAYRRETFRFARRHAALQPSPAPAAGSD
ncbi:MAG: C40 family peptidase [candidate division KSB1 bacterium]|nr:C40 family peptidase [candidate division KSB1 bacterium]MDZ7274761.1 C40 family peptidase [candidate division KSB1 bacterium]MDZ7285586.1 C40 family peptidase [candidate division KSB1 bacterium]MDZ7298618.1 C40 family peptidase [candidate division KSB1 bacterium]MDZ7307627.1 C40 family peptidase [candidate division KSB1 bacterium]